MFFHIVLERNMQLHPRHFGRNLRENLVSKLMKDVEGTCRFLLLQFHKFCDRKKIVFGFSFMYKNKNPIEFIRLNFLENSIS